MPYLLFTIYLGFFCWLLPRVPFIKKSGIQSKHIFLLFLIKMVAGMAIGWLSLHYYGPGNDYWDVNREGWIEYQLLINHPGEYFSNIFKSGYTNEYGGFFDSFQSYWNDLKNNLVIKMVSLCNIFSGGNYYINSLFFNALLFIAPVALYRIFINIYTGQYWQVIAGCFLLPSALYFTSGIHKDGVVFLLISLLLYHVYFAIKENRLDIQRISLILFFSILLFLTRSFIFMALLPVWAAWILSVKIKWPVWISFLLVYLVLGLVMFNVDRVFPSVRPLEMIVQKQIDYSTLPVASTQIELHSLQPNVSSFMSNAPQSLNHLLLRPYLWELPSKMLLPMNLELFFYHVLVLVLLFYHKKMDIKKDRFFVIGAFFFTFSVFIFIGFIIPNLGTLVRYRSLFLPFIITPLICSVNWEKLIKLKNKNI